MPTVPPAPRTSPSFGRSRSVAPPPGRSGKALPAVPRCEVLRHGPPEGDEAVMALPVQAGEEGGHVGVDDLRLEALEVEDPARGAVTAHDERAVVDAALGAEAFGQAAAPGALLTGCLVARPGHDVLQLLEGLERAGVDETGADEDVLVGEGQDGTAELVAAQRLERRVALRVAADRGQPP